MKTITRILAVMLALFCTVALMSACTSNDNDDNDKGGSIEFYIKYNGTKIELGKDATSVLSALGAPKDTASLGDCGGFGLQTRYTYDNFVVYTVKNDDGETIDQITLSNDIVETPKGICVGDSADDVVKAYGEPDAQSNTKIEYESGSFVLKFGIEGGDVKSINFIRITAK